MSTSSDGSSRGIPLASVSGTSENHTKALRLLFCLREVERQASIFNASVDDAMHAALELGDADRTWRHIQSAMFAAIVVNRLVSSDGARKSEEMTLSEARQAAQWRAKELRQLLALPEGDDQSVSILSVRKFRDSLEHIEDRIDRAFHSPSVLSLTDWYLSDGSFIVSPGLTASGKQRAALRAFYPEGGLLLFDRDYVDLFMLDIDMLRLRHNSREAQAEVQSESYGRASFGGGQFVRAADTYRNRVDSWRRKRAEIEDDMAPPVATGA